MTIKDIYDAARARKLVASRRQFSRDYLGRAGNYVADRGFGGCSAGALVSLFKRLGEARQADLQAEAFKLLLAAEAQDRGAGAVRP
jgi:hypothetical protein